MKANPTAIFATSVLWIVTLIGAYQIGRHQAADGSATPPATNASAARATTTDHGESSGSSRDRNRKTDKPPSVKQVFAQLKATLRPGAMQNPTVMMRAMALLDKLRPEDLTEALAQAGAMKDQQSKMMVYMTLLGKWAERDGPAAMTFAEEHAKDLGMVGSIMKMSVAAAWAESDPDAVWAWYKANKDQDSGGMLGGNQMVLMSVFSSLMTNDPDTAFKRLDELDAGARQMAFAGMCQTALFDDAKRQSLLDGIKAMPEGTEQTAARQMLLSQWAVLAPDEATQWIAQQPAAEQTALRDSMGMVLMMTDPKKGASFMMEGATDQEKPERYAAVIHSWARMDSKAASTWLAAQGDGPELDKARQAMIMAISDQDPADAMSRVNSITDPDLRFNAASSAYQALLRKDAAAADQALDNAGLTAEQLQKLRATEPP